MKTIAKNILLLILFAGMYSMIVVSCSALTTDNTEQFTVNSCDVLDSLMNGDWFRCCREQGIGCE